MAKDISYNGHEYYESLSKLIGKPIKDVVGYLSDSEFDFIVFKIRKIMFEDETSLDVGGEHDIAFVYKEALENVLGEEPLMDIFCEQNPDSC